MTQPEQTISLTLERTPYGDVEVDIPPAAMTSIGLHLSGRSTLEWTIDGRRQIGRPSTGQITLVPKGRAGSLRVRGGSFQILKIGIPDEAIAAWADGAERPVAGNPLIDRFAISDPFVHQVSLTLLKEVERSGTVDRLYRDALSNALLAHLVRRHSTLDATQSNGRVVHPLSQPRARRAVEFMEAHLNAAIGLDDIARELGLSPSHFAAQFRRSFGQSPARYLTWLRLERARLYLAANTDSIEHIAHCVGYASASHFSQAFQAMYGQTPSAFRMERGA